MNPGPENVAGHAMAGMIILVANAKKSATPEIHEGLLDFSAFQQDCQGGWKRYIFLEFLSSLSLFKQRK
jgi:hypothetical protein